MRPANRKFSSLPSDYEAILKNDSVISSKNNDDSIPSIFYNLSKISDIPSLNPKSSVDIFGVCYEVSKIQDIENKEKTNNFRKLDISIVDDSNSSIVITLWNKQAEDFVKNYGKNSLYLIKNVKIHVFFGYS